MGFTSIVGVRWRRNDGAGLSALQMIGVGVDGDRWRKMRFRNLAKKPMFSGAQFSDGVPDGMAAREFFFDAQNQWFMALGNNRMGMIFAYPCVS